jgi:hypothetical protein
MDGWMDNIKTGFSVALLLLVVVSPLFATSEAFGYEI